MKLKPEEKAALQARVKVLVAELAVLSAKKDDGNDQEKEENKSQTAIRQSELEASQGKLNQSDLEEQNEKLEAALVAGRTKDAEVEVQAAVRRGAIAIKDEEAQAQWKAMLIEDPAKYTPLVKAMRGKPALEEGRVIVNGVRIIREDSKMVLNAFAAETNPIKRAKLYNAEILARLKEGDPLPLEANNNLGTLVGTLVSQRTLELLKFTFPVLSSIATDFSDQNGKLNQTIGTRTVGIPTVQDYDPVNGWPDSDAVTVDIPVTMDKQKGVPIKFTAADLAGTVRRLFDEFGPAQAYALAKAMVDDLYSNITVANFGTNPAVVAAQIDFGRSVLIDIGAAMDDAGVPDGPMNRFILLNSQYYGQLKKDPSIVTPAIAQPLYGQIVEQGLLPDVEGFRVIKAPNLPKVNNLVGFAGSRSALGMAARLDGDYTSILPGASYGNVTVVTNPDLGISVLQVQYVDHQKAWARQRISLIFGNDPGQAAAGLLLKKA